MSSGSGNLRGRMASALTDAMRARDRVAVTALRSALSAVGNAEAVPVDTLPPAGAAETAASGVGVADAPRRELTEQDVRVAGRPDDAARVAVEADVLRELLASSW